MRNLVRWLLQARRRAKHKPLGQMYADASDEWQASVDAVDWDSLEKDDLAHAKRPQT